MKSLILKKLLKIKNKYKMVSEQFQYLGGINDGEQLYFDGNICYKIRDNYWKCSSCKARLSTKGKIKVDLRLKNVFEPLPKHLGHEPVSEEEYKIRRHFFIIKQRISTEIHVWPSTIFDEEIKKLQTEQKILKLAIATYVKPYAYYKSGFEARRAKTKPKMPSNFEDFTFEDPIFSHLKNTIDVIPQSFCNMTIAKLIIKSKFSHRNVG